MKFEALRTTYLVRYSFVVIQEFCYHGNVTYNNNFSSL